MVFDALSGNLVRALPATPARVNDLVRQFLTGQTLKGIVLRALPEGQALVNLAGQRLILDLGQAPIKGQTFLATVEQSAPTLVLKIMSDAGTQTATSTPPLLPAATPLTTAEGEAPQAANTTPLLAGQQQAPLPNATETSPATPGTIDVALLKSYLVAKQPFGDMATALQNILASSTVLRDIEPPLLHRIETTLQILLPQEATPPDATSLKEQVDRSGINYEVKVHQFLTSQSSPTTQTALANDLKGQLLELLARLEQVPSTGANAPNGEITVVRQHIQQALQNIEFQQLSNLFAQQQGQPLLVQLLHPFFAPPHTAKLYFRTDTNKKRTADRQDYTFLFLLDFSALGHVRIDATVRGSQVTATIRTEDKAVADFITAHAPELTSRLHDLGFQTEVHCCVQKHVAVDVDDSLTRILLADPSRLVDVTA